MTHCLRSRLSGLALFFVFAIPGCGGDSATEQSGAEVAARQQEQSDESAPVATEDELQQNAEPADTESALILEAREALAGFASARRLQDSETWRESEATLNRLGKDALPALVDALQADEDVVREQASARIAQLIEHLPDRSQLTDGLHDSSMWVRVNVASALSFGGDSAEQVIPVLRELCRIDDANLQQQVAIALGNYGSEAESAVDELIRLLSAEEPRVREAAATALGKIGPPARRAINPLKTRINDTMQDVRDAATTALERITDEP